MPETSLIVRGGRAIPPCEVEQVLLSHPAVAEVAVVGVPDRCWGVCRATVTGQLAVTGKPKLAPVDLFRPRAAIEDLGIPQQVRRSRALEDL